MWYDILFILCIPLGFAVFCAGVMYVYSKKHDPPPIESEGWHFLIVSVLLVIGSLLMSLGATALHHFLDSFR